MDQLWEWTRTALLFIVAVWAIVWTLMAVRYVLLGVAWALFWLFDRKRLRTEKHDRLLLQGENATLRDLVFKVGAGDQECVRFAALTVLQSVAPDLRPDLAPEQQTDAANKTTELITAAFVAAREKAVADVCRAKSIYRSN